MSKSPLPDELISRSSSLGKSNRIRDNFRDCGSWVAMTPRGNCESSTPSLRTWSAISPHDYRIYIFYKDLNREKREKRENIKNIHYKHLMVITLLRNICFYHAFFVFFVNFAVVKKSKCGNPGWTPLWSIIKWWHIRLEYIKWFVLIYLFSFFLINKFFSYKSHPFGCSAEIL